MPIVDHSKLPGIAAALVFLVLACTPGTPVQAPVSTATPSKSVEMPITGTEWDLLAAEARKEGTVNIYGSSLATVTEPLSQAFKQKFGINLEFVLGRPAEVTAKLNAERRAGLYFADVAHLGDTTALMDVKPLGITLPLDNLLLLPEIKNPQNWWGGKSPFADKDHHIITFMGQAVAYGSVNTDIVKEGDISSFPDILQPRWKGKIVFSDPTISGPGPNLMAGLVKVYGKERALPVFRQLATQEPLITREERMLVEWVARGKYPIGLAQGMSMFNDFKKAGAPIKIASFREPRYIGSGPGNVIVLSKNPHPKATQLYLNWLLSQEGATIWQGAAASVSRRVDVNKEGLDKDTIPRAEDFFPDEEQMKLRLEMRKVSADIFGQLMK